MADLITLDRLTAALPELTAAERALCQDHLIPAVSRAIERSCGRALAAGDFVEDHEPDDEGRIFLRNRPVNSLARVASGRVAALRVRNADPDTLRALAGLDMAGDVETNPVPSALALARTAAGITTIVSLPLASYPRLSDLAAAVAALGSGWSATAVAGYEPWPSADLVGPAGPTPAMGAGATFDVLAEDQAGHRLEARSGILHVGYCGGRWTATARVRVAYNAGYVTVPADLQQATVELVKAMLDRRGFDATIRSETDGAYSYTAAASAELEGMPRAVREVIASYRSLRR